MNPNCYNMVSIFGKSSLCLALGEAEWRASSLPCLVPLPVEPFLPSRSRKLELWLRPSSGLTYITIILIWSFSFAQIAPIYLLKHPLILYSCLLWSGWDLWTTFTNRIIFKTWVYNGSWTHPVYVFLKEMQGFQWLRPNNTSGEAYGKWGWGGISFCKLKGWKYIKIKLW